MSQIVENFLTLTQIPHCSKQAQKLFDFLVAFAKEYDYEVQTDEANNILISRGKPKLCLQAHYDMVCMGNAPHIETYEENGLLKAKDSSLGADNGMAIAMMMQLMGEQKELEFLLTADEEIGLIGANALAFDLQCEVMLNLDSEDEAEVYIGCAGGVDIVASKKCELEVGEGECYEVSVKDMVGGHSGVDIDKNISSALKVLSCYLMQKGVSQVASFRGGERRNSIAANATAVVYAQNKLESKSIVSAKKLNTLPKVLKASDLVDVLDGFKHGLHSYNKEFDIPQKSINLAIANTTDSGEVTIECSARGMSEESLSSITQYAKTFFQSYGFSVTTQDKYPSWKPEVNAFTKLVDEQMRAVYGKSKFMAIHAGLECGVIAQKYPHILFASIGPTIRYPHSTREEVDLASVDKTYEVLQKIVNYYHS